VAENGKSTLLSKKHKIVNQFNTTLTRPEDFILKKTGNKIRVIEANDGQLITGESQVAIKEVNGEVVSDIANDVLKIAVVNRYSRQAPALGFIRNFGLKRGAIASSVAHDSHNIIVVGVDDASISTAVNLIIEQTGGLSLVDGEETHTIALPVAGLMSDLSCESIGAAYSIIDKKAKELGSTLRAPYMSLSFMALLVIPQLKLSDKGLFDGKNFRFSEVFCE
jgi:adenine deaminase